MGTSQAVKNANHSRIVSAASELIRQRGTTEITVAEVMGAVSLTHGGFYAHFADRDALIDESIRHAFADGLARFEAALLRHPSGGLEGFVDVYLSARHRKGRAQGCAVAALAGDIARSSSARRQLFDAEFTAYVRRLIELTGADVSEADAGAILMSLAGAVAICRTLSPSRADHMSRAVRRMILRTEQ